ncbi:hypothetical protein [Helicobacter sp.]|uniref:hypothetical protein n=1 Tax=Helicobacter sp. TaxID=218 RepID=UPI002A74F17B|nr:hypothetical protein [Helicobacter sp.]MDY2585698.1 hypothetical protein [Helicobacter sp.]
MDYLVDHTCDFQSLCQGKGATMGSVASAIFRNTLFKKGLPSKIKSPKTQGIRKIVCGDSFRNFASLHDGKAYHSTKIDCVYRHHGGGEWSSLGATGQALSNALLWGSMWEYFDKKYMIFLLVSCQLYISNKEKIIEYLHSIKEDEKLRKAINEFKDLEDAFNTNMQKLVEFQNTLQANQ